MSIVSASQDQRIEALRIDQLRQMAFWVGGPVTILVFIFSIYTDYSLYPNQFNKYWAYARLGIVPLCVVCAYFFRKKTSGAAILNTGAFLIVTYICALHVMLMSQTGYSDSMYINAFVQVTIGIAVIPFSILFFSFFIYLHIGVLCRHC